MPNAKDTSAGRNDASTPSAAIQIVTDALNRLQYGSIQLTVHEGRLVQVDVTERNRFPA